MKVQFVLNGQSATIDADPRVRLIDILHRDFGLSRTRSGCYGGKCGACAILMNGGIVLSCLLPAFAVQNAEIVTYEGFLSSRDYQDIALAFQETRYTPCHFCTPGKVLSIHSLLENHLNPDDSDTLELLWGHKCGCTSYLQLLEAVQMASQFRRRRKREKRR